MLVDSHCHLDDKRFSDDLDAASTVHWQPVFGRCVDRHRRRPPRHRLRRPRRRALRTRGGVHRRPPARRIESHAKDARRTPCAGSPSEGGRFRRNRARLSLRFLAPRGTAGDFRSPAPPRPRARTADHHPYPRGLGRHNGRACSERSRHGHYALLHRHRRRSAARLSISGFTSLSAASLPSKLPNRPAKVPASHPMTGS